jgi:uncharacterized protein DUF4255
VPLPALESTLQSWLREQLPLPADVGDVSFDSPEATWGTSVTRPTVNLFLFEIARAAQQPLALPPRRDAGGMLVRDPPAPAVSFSYLLSAWGGGVREEHRLLGDAVRAVLRSPSLLGDPAQTGLVAPVQLALSPPEPGRARDLWSGLGSRLRASMVLVATTAVTLERPQPLSPPVQRVEVDVVRSEPAVPRRFVWFGASRQRERGRG